MSVANAIKTYFAPALSLANAVIRNIAIKPEPIGSRMPSFPSNTVHALATLEKTTYLSRSTPTVDFEWRMREMDRLGLALK